MTKPVSNDLFVWFVLEVSVIVALSQTTLPYSKGLQTTISNWMKVAEGSTDGKKTLWEKEKLLVMSNFSFSHSVIKRLVLQTRENQDLFGKRLKAKVLLPWSVIHVCVSCLYYIPSSEILEFPSVINFDIITNDNINIHFHFLP